MLGQMEVGFCFLGQGLFVLTLSKFKHFLLFIKNANFNMNINLAFWREGVSLKTEDKVLNGVVNLIRTSVDHAKSGEYF